MSTTVVNPFAFASPAEGSVDEAITFANAHGYLWGYQDGCRKGGVDPGPVPDGWVFAWLEYVRRHPGSRMAIQDAFPMWCDTGMLPGLDV